MSQRELEGLKRTDWFLDKHRGEKNVLLMRFQTRLDALSQQANGTLAVIWAYGYVATELLIKQHHWSTYKHEKSSFLHGLASYPVQPDLISEPPFGLISSRQSLQVVLNGL